MRYKKCKKMEYFFSDFLVKDTVNTLIVNAIYYTIEFYRIRFLVFSQKCKHKISRIRLHTIKYVV